MSAVCSCVFDDAEREMKNEMISRKYQSIYKQLKIIQKNVYL